MNTLQIHLKCLHGCSKGVAWAGAHEDIRKAWRACTRGDWLLWLAVKLGVEQRLVVFAACECAKLALQFTTDERPYTAIILAEQYASGDRDVVLDEVLLAAEDCKKAAVDAGCYGDFDASNAAYAAMHAANSVTLGGLAKDLSAAAAAEAAAEAGADAASCPRDADVARNALRLECAKVVRRRISERIIVPLWRRHVRELGG
jgi:hypothetical protein